MTETPTLQTFESAKEHHRLGDAAQAEALYRQVIAGDPNHADAHHLLGQLLSQMGRQDEALAMIQRAVVLNPLCAEYRTNLGVVLEAMGRVHQATMAYRVALELRPDLADASLDLGNALSKQQKWDEAISAYRAALPTHSKNPRIHNSLGAALYTAGQIDAAFASFTQAIQLAPDYAEAHNNLGNTFFRKGDLDGAIAEYQRASMLNPALSDAQMNLANALDRRGRRDDALAIHQLIAQKNPDHAPTQVAIGDAYFSQSRWDAAAEAYRRAIQLQPRDERYQTKLGHTLLAKMDLDGAATAYRSAIDLRPGAIEAINNLAMVHKEQGRLDEALDCIDQAIEVAPDAAAIHSNRIYLLSFHPGYQPAELAAEQRKWNERHARPLAKFIQPHRNDRSLDRRLKIGYVSPDFRQHVVGQNIYPLLSEHDNQRFEIFCYSGVTRPDAFTELLRPHADMWRNVAPRTDDELAEIIREDQIDILVDLSLHMAFNRLLVFARKPAPVQVTYLGYCASTGLDAIDYRLSDPYLDPPETDLSIYSEQTVRLPETYWCYGAAGATPQPAPPPSIQSGFITFGCLNNFAKVSRGALDLWAEILGAVPNSRLILHAYPGSHQDEVRARFSDNGVSPDRLEFITKQPWPKYVETYARIDIALDPFPYGGGITTCDALWMGVPVISLAGQTAVGRGGKSILSNIGLGELAVRRPRQYVQAAVALAQSPDRLAELRSSMRPRMLASPLMNARRFARNIEKIYREIWRQWCAAR